MSEITRLGFKIAQRVVFRIEMSQKVVLSSHFRFL
jgi:hypothetical protein